MLYFLSDLYLPICDAIFLHIEKRSFIAFNFIGLLDFFANNVIISTHRVATLLGDQKAENVFSMAHRASQNKEDNYG